MPKNGEDGIYPIGRLPIDGSPDPDRGDLTGGSQEDRDKKLDQLARESVDSYRFTPPSNTLSALKQQGSYEGSSGENFEYRLLHVLECTNRQHYLELIKKHQLSIRKVVELLSEALSAIDFSDDEQKRFKRFLAVREFLVKIPQTTTETIRSVQKESGPGSDNKNPKILELGRRIVKFEAIFDLLIHNLILSGQSSRRIGTAERYSNSNCLDFLDHIKLCKYKLADQFCQLVKLIEVDNSEKIEEVEKIEEALEAFEKYIDSLVGIEAE